MEILILLFASASVANISDLFFKALRIKGYQLVKESKDPVLSIIVCAHNEEENLKELLPILSNQNYSNYELILVLDRCSDESKKVSNGFLNDHIISIEIEQCPEGNHPKKYGITRAIEIARGDWMVLTDADCRPGPNWLKEMAKGMGHDKDVVLGLSPYFKRQGFLNTIIQYETFLTSLYFISAAVNSKTYMALGRNVAYRKSTFIEKGGFGENIGRTGGDDDLLIQRLATKSNVAIQISKDAHVDSISETNWDSYIRQKIRHFSVANAYTRESKRTETYRWAVHILFWALFPVSFLINWQLTVLIFVGSFLMKAISINIVSYALEKRFNHLWVPIVDLTYVVLFPLLSLRSLLVKRITWK